MDKIVLRTVPHTGTNFMQQMLSSAGFPPSRIEHYDVTTTSFVDDPMEIIVSPIRDPRHVYGTWCARYSNNCSVTPTTFYASWFAFNRAFMDISMKDRFYILPLDTDDRDDHLRKLSKRLVFAHLTTDWKPVSSQESRYGPSVPPDKESMPRVLEEVMKLPVVVSFYGGK
jgi:hypothetical protein